MRSEPLREVPPGIVLRDADVVECWKEGLSPEEAIELSIKRSLISEKVVLDGKILGVWGWRPSSAMGSVVYVWMLTTPEADLHKKAFGRLTLRYCSALLERYSTLIVYVDTHHEVAMKWLSWLGFQEVERQGDFATMVCERAN